MSSGTILLVDDDERLGAMLRANFEVIGFDVVVARDADAALAALERRDPDAIVLDAFPHDRGAHAVRRIRKHPRGGAIPLVVLTARGAAEAVDALDAGADDVVTRPFDPEEMLARVRGKIARVRSDMGRQPLTKLPGNEAIESTIRRRLALGVPWSFLYCDLDGFKAFNDAFGFAAGDEVITLLASTLREAVRRYGDQSDFIGHVGGDDFVLVTVPERADALAEAVIARFDRAIRTLQRDTRVPYCSVSIAAVSGSTGAASYERVAERIAAVKKVAKRRHGSVVVKGELR